MTDATDATFARFQGKVALISGAAAGICRASAEIIAAEGGIVAAVDINRELLDGAMQALAEAGGGEHMAYCANALEQEDVDAVVADVIDRYGRIDILINGVGGSTIIDNSAARADELTMDEWQKILDFNLSGTFLFCHAVIPHMTRQGSGKIVNFASIAGRGRSASSSSAYAAAKGGIIAFTKKLSLEVGPAGINVNAIAPSATLTERIRRQWEGRPTELRERAVEGTPLGRLAEPIDQANVVCFLASSHADFVTGVTIDVTGGA